MADGVLLDTSFLITLADKNRDHHETARRYWRHFVENNITIYLSTIVVSEFCVKQAIPPDILRCCIVLPFNWDDALKAAALDWKRVRPDGVEREALKDDIKIIAQAAIADAAYVVTADERSFYRFCETFKSAAEIAFKPIQLAAGFDRAAFDANGQSDFEDMLEGKDEKES